MKYPLINKKTKVRNARVPISAKRPPAQGGPTGQSSRNGFHLFFGSLGTSWCSQGSDALPKEEAIWTDEMVSDDGLRTRSERALSYKQCLCVVLQEPLGLSACVRRALAWPPALPD